MTLVFRLVQNRSLIYIGGYISLAAWMKSILRNQYQQKDAGHLAKNVSKIVSILEFFPKQAKLTNMLVGNFEKTSETMVVS